MDTVGELVEQLTAKNNTEGYEALKELLARSKDSDEVSRYMARFIELTDSDDSYIRTRALRLVSANAVWDTDYLIDENIDKLLKHVTDFKPITARQFIQSLPELAQAKPDLREDILTALRRADTLRYPLSMRTLVDEDIRRATVDICRTKAD